MPLLVRFHLRPRRDKVSQINGVVCMPFHVQDIAMQRHRRIVQHGDGSPGLIRKALSEKRLTAMHACFISEALEMPKTPPCPKKPRVLYFSKACGPMARVRPRCFQCVDHLSSSATKLCSDARFMTASFAGRSPLHEAKSSLLLSCINNRRMEFSSRNANKSCNSRRVVVKLLGWR